MNSGISTHRFLGILPGFAAVLLAMSSPALGFQSGSTEADGAFSPTVDTEVQLPPSGVFNYTTVNIPTGVTVKFKRNVANTPVVILATGDVTIAGTINISGGNAKASGAAGDGNLGDDGIPGAGGPGGFDGGQGGAAGVSRAIAGAGQGPGGGAGGIGVIPDSCFSGGASTLGGAGGGFGSLGTSSTFITVSCTNPTFTYPVTAGPTYGSSQLLPLIGGSGGGGGGGGTNFIGSGGGGGGGAILIASSRTVNVTGSILANGGNGGASAGTGAGSPGGGGSGGAIRIMASTLAGNGAINANGGNGGGVGRVRLESDAITRTAATSPPFTFSSPGVLFVAGFPSLKITSVAGVTAPAEPTGNADITLPSSTANPVTVTFATTNVPVGNVVKLLVTPQGGAVTTVTSTALTGTNASATSSVQVTLPGGPSVLFAQTTYTIVASLGDELSRYAQGERVDQVRLSATLNGQSSATLITASGKEFDIPAAALASAGISQ